MSKHWAHVPRAIENLQDRAVCYIQAGAGLNDLKSSVSGPPGLSRGHQESQRSPKPCRRLGPSVQLWTGGQREGTCVDSSRLDGRVSAACRGLSRLGPFCRETRLGSPGCNADIPSSARSRSGLRCGCRLERHAASRSVPASPACHSGRSGPGLSLPRRPYPDSTEGPYSARAAPTSAVAFSEEQQPCCLLRSGKNR